MLRYVVSVVMRLYSDMMAKNGSSHDFLIGGGLYRNVNTYDRKQYLYVYILLLSCRSVFRIFKWSGVINFNKSKFKRIVNLLYLINWSNLTL